MDLKPITKSGQTAFGGGIRFDRGSAFQMSVHEVAGTPLENGHETCFANPASILVPERVWIKWYEANLSPVPAGYGTEVQLN